MSTLSRTTFLKTLPAQVIAGLPAPLQGIKVRQQFSWLIQFNYGEPRLHYEVSAIRNAGYEIGFHCEARDKTLNRFLLYGFRRHLFEIKDTLGAHVEAEMWDRGWTKIYEVVPPEPLSEQFQADVGRRTARFIRCIHPIFVELRQSVMHVHR